MKHFQEIRGLPPHQLWHRVFAKRLFPVMAHVFGIVSVSMIMNKNTSLRSAKFGVGARANTEMIQNVIAHTTLPHRSFSRQRRFLARGFSLIELLVVISIFSMITIVVLANHSRFNGSVLLGNLAYDIALSVREAQVYGLSVKQFDSQFQVGYGVHFSDSSTYILFADVNPRNNRYDLGTDSIIQTNSLGKGHFILRYCAENSVGVTSCSDSRGSPPTYLDIVFFRPDPDATINTNEPTVYSRGAIVVASPLGETRTITVASTGQISVTNP